ncbi:MAG: hypothetical protein VXZ82_08285 [Planctomycetota bacterium]|nr:hypothetical protein [Planctomycetota bacterium]
MTFDLVFVSAWLAAALFFWARLHGLREAPKKRLDQSGAVLLWLHILIAYVLTHQGSHSAAVEHVAIRTEETVGIRSGIGIYANYLTAFLWSLCAFTCITSHSQMMRWMIEGFLWMMFISASVVFAERTSSIVFAVLSLAVACSYLARSGHPSQNWNTRSDRRNRN